ncbi:MAG: LamG domain-containing protein, partial [Victivallales bacterium]|nr:LamG domain-containing protein [Victivallales bacterium]
MRRLLLLILALSAFSLTAQDGPLLHWTFDEGQGETVKDMSGNGLDGTMGAHWVESPSGKAAFLDGTAATVMKVNLPDEQRFGKESWSFSAWVKPQQFKINDRQNQRRIFAFGMYPAAYLVIDIMAAGNLNCYFCYKDENDKTISTGGSSPVRLEEGKWGHVALVCDREANKVWLYVNGYAGGGRSMPPGFAGDYSLGNELTIGNGWHNYWGTMDEVKIYRRALAVSDEQSHSPMVPLCARAGCGQVWRRA